MLRERNDTITNESNVLELVASAAHDLQVPLHSISQFCGYLKKESSKISREEIDRSFDAIIASAERLEIFVSDMLELARIGAHGITIEPEQIDVLDLVHRVLQIAPLPGGWSADIWVSEELTWWVDPIRAEQILTNLISNSYHHGVSPLFIHADEKTERTDILIGDGGPGLPEHSARRLFRAFERGASTSVAGTGLGLSIAVRLTAEMGGRLSYENGRSPAFRVSLPSHPR